MASTSHDTFITIGGDAHDGVDYTSPDVVVHLASQRNPHWDFVDDGDEIELYVVLAPGLTGIPCNQPSSSTDEIDEHALEVHLANQIVPLVPLVPIMQGEQLMRRMYKAVATVTSTRRLIVGEPVPFTLQYRDVNGIDQEISSVTPPNKNVYYQPVWKELRKRNVSLKETICSLSKTEEMSTHDDENEYEILDTKEFEESFTRSDTPVQLAKDDFFLYYTRKACSPFLMSKNPLLRFLKELMVAPLTNFTGLSLYYQLYLVEIFHMKFYTKAGHYLCMPVIVLLMATWFAQWRFIGDYTVQDFTILIFNGTAVFLLVLQVWYIVWGFCYRMYLFGIFMIWPLIVIYILANMMFQLIVINSLWVKDSELSLSDVTMKWGQNITHWYDFITLSHFYVLWYFHPLIWALVFCFLQALSHIWEEKLPPRVSQTSHWLDVTTVLKQNGYVATGFILLSQTIFGTLNEFFASPRLLPLLLLRICYTMGYEEKVWLKFHYLVEDCLKYGNPAIDYIGRGGTKVPRIPKEMNHPDELEKTCKEIECGLCEKQKQGLQDLEFLKDPKRFTPLLQYYVLLRHQLTKYRIQVHAYGPFTPQGGGDCKPDNMRMENDFPHNASFKFFLDEVRASFAEMEWQFINEHKLRRI